MKKANKSISISQFYELSAYLNYIGNIYVDKKNHTIKFPSSLPITLHYSDNVLTEIEQPTESMNFNVIINTLDCPMGEGIIHDDDTDYKIGLFIDESAKEIIFFDFNKAIIEEGEILNLDKIPFYAKCEWNRTEEDIIITVETEDGQTLLFPSDFKD